MRGVLLGHGPRERDRYRHVDKVRAKLDEWIGCMARGVNWEGIIPQCGEARRKVMGLKIRALEATQVPDGVGDPQLVGLLKRVDEWKDLAKAVWTMVSDHEEVARHKRHTDWQGFDSVCVVFGKGFEKRGGLLIHQSKIHVPRVGSVGEEIVVNPVVNKKPGLWVHWGGCILN